MHNEQNGGLNFQSIYKRIFYFFSVTRILLFLFEFNKTWKSIEVQNSYLIFWQTNAFPDKKKKIYLIKRTRPITDGDVEMEIFIYGNFQKCLHLLNYTCSLIILFHDRNPSRSWTILNLVYFGCLRNQGQISGPLKAF